MALVKKHLELNAEGRGGSQTASYRPKAGRGDSGERPMDSCKKASKYGDKQPCVHPPA